MISLERVDSVNAANAAANKAQRLLAETLTPYLNRKAWKISGYGGPVAALERDLKALQEALPGSWLTLQKSFSWFYGSLRVDNTNSRVEISVGKISEDGTLLEIFEPEQRRTDFTFQEVSGAFDKARELEREAREILATVREFQR